MTRQSDLHYDIALKIDNPGCAPLDTISYESSEFVS